MSDFSVILWTVAHQSPLSMGFPRQEFWHGLSFPSPGDLPNPGIEPTSPVLEGRFFTTEPPESPLLTISSLHSLSHVQLFVTPWTAAYQASLPIINSRSLLKLMPIKLVIPSNIQPSHPVLSPTPPAFNLCPVLGSFPVSQLFASSGQSTGVSASAPVLPMNIQD